jgi:spermidine synthase
MTELLSGLMDDWDIRDAARVPGGGQITLYQRDQEFSIWIDTTELMGSDAHESEDELARFALADPKLNKAPHVLVGGLGMGYTLAAALKDLPEGGRISVAELIPEVVKWNRGPLGHLAGHPLKDERVTVVQQDVGRLLQTHLEEYDVILLDVDNGPEGLVRGGNDWLYSEEGLESAYTALKPGGILGVWSTFRDPAFYMRLKKICYRDVRQERVLIEPNAEGYEHVIWFARRELE